MTTTKFHKAAKDGLVDVLKEATRKDCNSKDEDGMTPTLWAAHEGKLDALRILVGRGGNPEKANYHFGQNALHIAASKGHMNCVSFLVAFNVNIWAMDHDFHTAMELAGMNDRQEILSYLDNVAAKLEMNNRRKCMLLKEKAEKEAERRLKKFEERSKKEREKQKRQIKKMEKEHEVKPEKHEIIVNGTLSRKSSHESNGQTFTEIVGNGTTKKSAASTGGIKKILDRRLKNNSIQGRQISNGYNLKEICDDTSTKSVRSLFEQRQNHKNNDFNDYCTTGKRGRIKDLFDIRNKLHRSTSQPDLLVKLRNEMGDDKETPLTLHDSGSLFDRPGFGSVSFRQTIPMTLSTLPPVTNLCPEIKTVVKDEECSIGSAGSLAKRILPSHTKFWDTTSSSVHSSDDENSITTLNKYQLPPPLHRFLLAVGVTEYESKFAEQRIDMDALFMLNDDDLISLGLPLGPRRKLLNAIKDYKQQSDRCKEIFEKTC